MASDSYIYMEISKGIPGLKQARRIASDRLPKNLIRNGYTPVPHIPSLWGHHTSDLLFSIVISNFGIKYTQKEDSDHLLKSLQEDNVIIKDWTGDKYPGLTLKWDYVNRNVSVYMPRYVKEALLKFQREANTKPQDSQHRWN